MPGPELARLGGVRRCRLVRAQPRLGVSAIRSRAALIDVSPLFKYRIRGDDAERFLNRVITRNVAKCAERRVLYTPWCDEAGKVIDDGTLARLGSR